MKYTGEKKTHPRNQRSTGRQHILGYMVSDLKSGTEEYNNTAKQDR